MAESNDQLAADMDTLAKLRQLADTLMIMQKNLILAVSGSGKTRTVVGGDLYSIAAEEYGDAAQWALIARANNIVDPFLDGFVTLIIPPLNGQDTGGVWSA